MSRTWLFVPFKHKDSAKLLGAQWDHTRKQWYINDADYNKGIEQWLLPKLEKLKLSKKKPYVPPPPRRLTGSVSPAPTSELTGRVPVLSRHEVRCAEELALLNPLNQPPRTQK